MPGSSQPTASGQAACPFVYANGKACSGHIVRVEAYKADLDWSLDKSGVWQFSFGPRSHYHLFCSEKGNHAGPRRPDDPQMKAHWRDLPDEIRNILESTEPEIAPRTGDRTA